MNQKILRWSVLGSAALGTGLTGLLQFLPAAHADGLTVDDIHAVLATSSDTITQNVKTNVLFVVLIVLGLIFVFGLIGVLLYWAFKGIRWLMHSS